ncbi:hypothetical protein APE_1610.1 [Aeropyrum pernix K1]|uniref:Uncharacterized protein n=1 Tax=Aeropyrum pernix (strain ATCC 700893 / DSM 11879 / JCM 9820 / NBRC 100138 / K1) TaxID=272557 RepID=Q9YBI8_AERPE|nr:hypothetical protein [Aeropyrum pernix]BAA80610.2 hypothetical protein APE_1610.1 [Aeropyrum pernix K1]
MVEITGETLANAIVVLILAALPSVAWFFQVRKRMIRRQSSLVKLFEQIVKPRDRRYVVHGYLVGFTAEYWVNRGPIKKVYITYTTPPYHAFFYLPIIILFRRREKLEVAVEARDSLGVRGEAHIYRRGGIDVVQLVEKDVKQSPLRRKLQRLKLPDLAAEAYATEGDALAVARELWGRLARLGAVFRVSIVPSRRLVLAVASPRPDSFGPVVEEVLSIVQAAAEKARQV